MQERERGKKLGVCAAAAAIDVVVDDEHPDLKKLYLRNRKRLDSWLPLSLFTFHLVLCAPSKTSDCIKCSRCTRSLAQHNILNFLQQSKHGKCHKWWQALWLERAKYSRLLLALFIECTFQYNLIIKIFRMSIACWFYHTLRCLVMFM